MNEAELKIYNQGIQEGKKHSEPSTKTMDELTKIKENCSKHGTEMAIMNEKLNSIETKIDAFIIKMESLEKVKADKEEVDRIRRNIDWGVKLVLGAVILALIALVIKS